MNYKVKIVLMCLYYMQKIGIGLHFIKHSVGFHNKNCRRRVFTTKNKYLCMVTGKIGKKHIIKSWNFCVKIVNK